jgi:DNA-binding protein HU-beta
LNTTELIDALAEADDLPKSKAKEVVNSIFFSVIEAAKRGEETVITGFGRSR